MRTTWRLLLFDFLKRKLLRLSTDDTDVVALAWLVKAPQDAPSGEGQDRQSGQSLPRASIIHRPCLDPEPTSPVAISSALRIRPSHILFASQRTFYLTVEIEKLRWSLRDHHRARDELVPAQSESSPRLFLTNEGGMVTENTVRRTSYKYVRKNCNRKTDVKPHDSRRTFAT